MYLSLPKSFRFRLMYELFIFINQGEKIRMNGLKNTVESKSKITELLDSTFLILSLSFIQGRLREKK